MSVSFGVSDAVELGYAAASRVAYDCAARSLAIKGPVPEAHGLRTERASFDVDVLVAPEDFQRMVERFQSLGWERIGATEDADVFPSHSSVLSHPAWPITIDLHHRFPGFLYPAGQVFDALWAERCELSIAGRAVWSAGRAGSTLVAALHALRTPDRAGSVSELNELVSRWTSLNADRAALITLANDTGGVHLCAPFFSRISVTVPESDDAEVRRAVEIWRSRSRYNETSGIGWALAVRRAPWRQRPTLLLRAILTTDESVLRRYGASADGRGRWAARARRARHFLGEAPNAAWLLWHGRRNLVEADDRRREDPL